MPVKKSKSSGVQKSIDIKPRTPSSTSRPVIVSNGPLLRDPMLSTDDKKEAGIGGAPPLAGHGRTIVPLSEIGEANEKPVSVDRSEGKAAPTASELVEKLQSRSQPEGAAKPSASDAESLEAEAIAKPAKTEEAEAATGGTADKTQAESVSENPSQPAPEAEPDAAKSDEVGDKPPLKTNPKTDVEAEARRARELDDLVASEKYFIPVNAVKRRHARQWLAILIIIVLALIALDLLFDAGVLKINGFNPPTDFFQH